MDTINLGFLILHVISGYISLTCGSISMISKKGGKVHKLSGRLFFNAMIGLTISALYLSIVKDNSFLLHVGIFVFYQTVAGRQSIKVKSLKPVLMDALVLIITGINACFMLLTGNVVLIVFGGISILLIGTDLNIYYKLYNGKELNKLVWMSRHIGMMMGAYIGAFTAFLVVNIQSFQPYWIIWLSPTIILVPLMQYWTWKFTRKPIQTPKTA